MSGEQTGPPLSPGRRAAGAGPSSRNGAQWCSRESLCQRPALLEEIDSELILFLKFSAGYYVPYLIPE